MLLHAKPELTMPQIISPVIVAVTFILACGRFKEPNRRNFSAIVIAGAGAAYLNGGLGWWEFAFCAVITCLAYWGLKDYRFIAAGWLLHTGWDVLHHLYGNPIVPFAPSSSAGCAICDSVLALWYFSGAPPIARSIAAWFRRAAV
jgi:hypothetical protein